MISVIRGLLLWTRSAFIKLTYCWFSPWSICTWRALSKGRTTSANACCSFYSLRLHLASLTNILSSWWRLFCIESTSTFSQAGWRALWPFYRWDHNRMISLKVCAGSGRDRVKMFLLCLCAECPEISPRQEHSRAPHSQWSGAALAFLHPPHRVWPAAVQPVRPGRFQPIQTGQ